MKPIARTMFLLFFPACLAILKQVIWGQELTHQVLALGIFLFCIEQARMATYDLQLIADARKQVQDDRLRAFWAIAVSTISIELLGFYTSSIWPGWGSIIILVSQIWFNLFANIKIQPSTEIVIQPWKISERLPVLMADVLGIFLVSLWMLQVATFWISWGLLVMTIGYGGVKLVLFITQKSKTLFT